MLKLTPEAFVNYSLKRPSLKKIEIVYDPEKEEDLFDDLVMLFDEAQITTYLEEVDATETDKAKYEAENNDLP